MTLMPGRMLSHYRLIAPIGEGGMGVVWRATDTTLDRDVAIKVLPEAFSLDPERMARFEREAKILASLNHPHIASIYGLASADGVRFLAMELVEGADLAVRLEQGPMPVAEALDVARQTAEALEAAHEKGIIHRDLKPANIKVTSDGQVKVLDFGLAKALEGESAQSGSPSLTQSPTLTGAMTAANVILGTAAYMSPEQARGKAVDRRADIWAFGGVLYECLTARRAFVGETVSDTLAKILERDPDYAALPKTVPARVVELLRRCLAKEARTRLRDIGDARIVLEEVLATRSPSGTFVAPQVEHVALPNRRRFWIPFTIAAVIGLGIGAGVWRLLSSGDGGKREPQAFTVSMPSDVMVRHASLSSDGRSIIVAGLPKSSEGSDTPEPTRIYTRPIGDYTFKPIRGTEGVVGYKTDRDGRGVYFIAPVMAGSTQRRLLHVFLEGGAPPTALVDWQESWGGLLELQNGDLLVESGPTSFVRIPKGHDSPSTPVAMDAGRPGVVRYELGGEALPGDRGAIVNVVSYDDRGWHYSVAVMDDKTGKVKIVVDDGGNATYSQTGHLLFARADALFAVPFDLGKLEARGKTVAVWSGLNTSFSVVPGTYRLRSNGRVFYLPGEAGGTRQLAHLDASGGIHTWSPDRRPVDGAPEPSPDGRRFVCSLVSGRGIDEIWVSDLARPGFRRIGTDPNADCYAPLWHPDGKRVLYRRRGGDGQNGLYIQNVDGGVGKRILATEETMYTAGGWLPGGSGLILWRITPGKNDLWMLPFSGDEPDTNKLVQLLPSAFNQINPRVSRDGHLLAYQSDESGKMMSYVVEMRSDGTPSNPIQVQTTGSITHLWSEDGRMLFVEDERHRLMRIGVTRTPELSLSSPIQLYDFDKLAIALWTVFPDGSFFVGLKSSDEIDITHYNLVLNFDEELKRRMRAAQ